MSKFYKGLLPWLVVTGVGTIFLQYFLRIKFEQRQKRKGELQYLGLSSNASLDELYKEMVEDQNLDDWSNVRGPRQEEDNAQYEEAKARRKAELEAKREQFRPRREEFMRRLEQVAKK